MPAPAPTDDNYDSVKQGVRVSLVTDTGSLGDSIDANTAALIALKASVDALAELMAPH